MTIAAIIRKFRAENPRVRISAFDFDGHIWIFNIEVEADYQNQGIGTAAIRALQQCNQTLALIPMSLDDRQEQLENWYYRLGFRWEGNKKQMVWRPI